MNKTEQVAFVIAFDTSNGNFPTKRVERFVSSLCGDGEEKHDYLYSLDNNLYSSILDAMDLWESARQFERGFKMTTHMINELALIGATIPAYIIKDERMTRDTVYVSAHDLKECEEIEVEEGGDEYNFTKLKLADGNTYFFHGTDLDWSDEPIYNSKHETFALKQWLSDYRDLTYPEVLKALDNNDFSKICLWKIVEGHTGEEIIDFIEDTKESVERTFPND